MQEYSEAKTITVCDMKSKDKINFVIKRCTQSAHYKYLFPGTEHQYTSTLSNQTVSLIKESNAQTIPTSGFTWKSVSQPWSYKLLEREEEDPMLKIGRAHV